MMIAATVAVTYLLAVALLRELRAKRMKRLTPAAMSGGDPNPLAWQLAFVEFPFMFEAGTSLGFFSTFAVPTIAVILRSTRGFELACQLRYDDTMLLMHEIGEHGTRSARGKAALERVKAIHARTKGIKQEDMLYTLWVFCFEPVRWVNAYEWRAIEPYEKDALYQFWREVGEGLSIGNIPATCQEFEEWGSRFEAERFRATKASEALTRDVITLAASWGPRWLPGSKIARACKYQLVVWLLCALSRNQQVIDAVGLAEERRKMPRLIAWMIRGAVLARAFFVRWMLPPRPNWWPGTLTGAPVRAAAPHPTVNGSSLKTCPYRSPHDAVTYRDQGTYSLDELGRPLAAAAQVQ